MLPALASRDRDAVLRIDYCYMSLTKNIIYLSFILVTALFGVVKFRHLTTPLRLLVLLVCYAFISESIAEYLRITIKNNPEVYHFYVIISFWLNTLIYLQILESIKTKLTFIIIAIAFTLFGILNSLLFQKLNSVPSINLTVNNVILVIFSLIVFRHLTDQNPFEPIQKNWVFYFNATVLIYFTIQIFNWGILNYLLKSHVNIMPIIYFNYFINILYYIALGITIWVGSGKQKTSELLK